jgi:hypothetical protein
LTKLQQSMPKQILTITGCTFYCLGKLGSHVSFSCYIRMTDC